MSALQRLRTIVGDRMTLDTLGGKRKFQALSRGSSLIIIPSSDKQYRVTADIARKVSERFDSLPANQRYRAGQYVRPYWADCPNNILAPYIARILKEGE